MKHIRRRFLLKAFAVFFLLEIITSTIAPAVSWALTSGPTAPEATSFEPVDTTDMVNLNTGDLAYNLPLLEVPGPSGGYPLSLSYHAGIQPNEDASWTGLGWTLNPGAITRNVNGFADDHQSVSNSSRFFWDGGSTTTYSAGVSIGIGGTPLSVSAGLSFSQDTYQGMGIGGSLGVGMQLGGENSPVGLNASVGVDPYGGSYVSTGVGVTVAKSTNEAQSLSVGVGYTTNFNQSSYSAHVGMGHGTNKGALHNLSSSIGASMTSGQGVSVGASVAGATFSNNARSGRVSTSGDNFFISIPIYAVSINLGYKYQRYWIDQVDETFVNGSLYYPDASSDAVFSTHDFDHNNFDTYSLLDPTGVSADANNPNPESEVGGSFPNMDNYYVNAQGLSGAMRPYYFQKHLYKRNNYSVDDDGDYQYSMIQYDVNRSHNLDKRAEFRFQNDFSNRFEYAAPELYTFNGATIDGLMQYSFGGGAKKIGESGTEEYTSNQIQGSRSVLWFTNEEIIQKAERVQQAGFIETTSTGYDRDAGVNASKAKQIGGYTIINESGVKYHFALPAYSYDEYMYSGKKTGTQTYNDFHKHEPYAYTWYLTAVTGSDYVDRGPNGTADGILNEYDWGYWVNFEYGKWTDSYAWRNPSEGMSDDVDQNFENFSEGRKELYYLDAVRTKTHTALFFKDIRHDAKGSVYFRHDYQKRISLSGNRGKTKETMTEASRPGGFTPASASCTCTLMRAGLAGIPIGGKDYGKLDYRAMPTSSMKLNSIILVKNDDLKGIPLSKGSGEYYNQEHSYPWTIYEDNMASGMENCDFSTVIERQHYGENVLDKYDLAQVETSLLEKALRRLRFDTDYSLTPGTPNSFDFAPLKASVPSSSPASYPKLGKLTLNAVYFDGIKGADVLPPIRFAYDVDQPVVGVGTLTLSSGSLSLTTNAELWAGDIITFKSNDRSYYAVIKSHRGGVYNVKALAGATLAPGDIVFRTTKNPPYDKDAVDMWGLYKSDFVETGNDTRNGVVTEVSGKGLDVWSLRTVTLPAGAKISFQYEADEYAKAVLNANYDFAVANIVNWGALNQVSVFFDYLYSATPLDSLKPGKKIKLDLAYDVYENSIKVSSDVYSGIGEIKRIPTNGGTLGTFVDVESSALAGIFSVSRDVRVKYGHFYPGNNKVGGGIRVASVSLSDGSKVRTTSYDYTHNGSSGLTSYEPSLAAGSLKGMNYNWDNQLSTGNNLLSIARELPAPGVLYSLVTVSESVTQDNGKTYPALSQKIEYEFEPFSVGMVGVDYAPDKNTALSSQQSYENYIGYGDVRTRNIYLKDYTSRVGTLKRVAFYNGFVKTTETFNHYLHDGLAGQSIPNENTNINDDFERNWKLYEPRLEQQFNNQGVMEETFTESRFFKRHNDNFILLGVATKREQFPAIQVGQTTKNYTTGVVTEKSTVAFDYYSGQVVKAKETDSYGNVFLTETTPAYRVYPSMTLAAKGGKNMLTQEAASYTYKVNPVNETKLGLAAATVTTWSDNVFVSDPERNVNNYKQPGIWRKRANYAFVGAGDATLVNGLYTIASVTPFASWNNEALPEGSPWLKTGETTLYDPYSHAMEGKDVYDRYASVKMSADLQGVLGAATNARYNEFACTGVEDVKAGVSGGGVTLMNGVAADYGYKHTGRASARIDSGIQGLYTNVQASTAVGNQMHVSFWVHKPTASKVELLYQFTTGGIGPIQEDEIIEFDLTKTDYAGDWYLCEADIPVPTNSGKPLLTFASQVHNGGGSPIYVDDLRVHSIRSGMTTYVYNTWGSVSHILDNNNLFTQYDYDDVGRLTSTTKESFQRDFGSGGVVKVNQIAYNYGKSNVFTVVLTASSDGTTGAIRPVGTMSVPQNGEQVFELIDACSPSKFIGLWVDGQSINLSQTRTLVDGTVVKRTGNTIIFSNVQNPHAVRTSFAVNSTLGRVECAKSDYGNGRYCYEGFWNWTYLDDCGEPIEWNTAMRKDQIPADLRSLAIDNCCTLSPAGAGCGCYDISDND